jgi:hypothetical protein
LAFAHLVEPVALAPGKAVNALFVGTCHGT